MANKIITTLSCCIGSMQLKLSILGLENPSFEKILTEKFQSPKLPRNVNESLNLLADNHFEYVKEICPNCGLKHVNKQEFRERNPILGEYGQQKSYLRRYQCKRCNKKFTSRLDSVVKPKYRYANVFMEKLEAFIGTGYRSLRKTAEDFQTFLGVPPSHQSIKNWQVIEPGNRIENIKTNYSGYYCCDEQFIKLNGQKQPFNFIRPYI